MGTNLTQAGDRLVSPGMPGAGPVAFPGGPGLIREG
jgi:hypothetical protein